jgi:hypothetical protein
MAVTQKIPQTLAGVLILMIVGLVIAGCQPTEPKDIYDPQSYDRAGVGEGMEGSWVVVSRLSGVVSSNEELITPLEIKSRSIMRIERDTAGLFQWCQQPVSLLDDTEFAVYADAFEPLHYEEFTQVSPQRLEFRSEHNGLLPGEVAVRTVTAMKISSSARFGVGQMKIRDKADPSIFNSAQVRCFMQESIEIVDPIDGLNKSPLYFESFNVDGINLTTGEVLTIQANYVKDVKHALNFYLYKRDGTLTQATQYGDYDYLDEEAGLSELDESEHFFGGSLFSSGWDGYDESELMAQFNFMF